MTRFYLNRCGAHALGHKALKIRMRAEPVVRECGVIYSALTSTPSSSPLA